MHQIGNFILPIFLFTVIISCFIKKVKIFDEFIIGAKEGIQSAVSLLPSLILLITAVKMLTSSGAVDVFSILFPFPKEIITLSLLKPISGSGSLALLQNIFENNSPDSFIGNLSSIIFCSYDTVFYVVSVYFSSVSYKKGGKVIVASLLGYIFSIILSFILLKLEASLLL